MKKHGLIIKKKIMNLFDIIKHIEDKNWCFQYGGACGTCGMTDVKNFFKQFEFQNIIALYKNLDYIHLNLNYNEIEGLKKIYSLLTSNYTVFNNDFDFKKFEEELNEKYPNSDLLKNLFLSNNMTYWKSWKEEQNNRKQIELDKTLDREIEMEKYTMMKSKDKSLQNSDYRKNLIDNLKSKNIDFIIEYLAEDEEHTIKFYPSVLVVTAEDRLELFNRNHLQKINNKLSFFDVRKSPWKRFKKKLRWYLDGKEWYE